MLRKLLKWVKLKIMNKETRFNVLRKEYDLDYLLKFIVNKFGFSEKMLAGENRKRELVFARHMFSYLGMTILKEEHYNSISLALIGSVIKKDHSTVLHAVKTINNLCDTNRAINNLVIQTIKEFKIHHKNKTIEIIEILKYSEKAVKIIACHFDIWKGTYGGHERVLSNLFDIFWEENKDNYE